MSVVWPPKLFAFLLVSFKTTFVVVLGGGDAAKRRASSNSERGSLLWMGKILHHFETLENQCLLIFTGIIIVGFLGWVRNGFRPSTVGLRNRGSPEHVSRDWLRAPGGGALEGGLGIVAGEELQRLLHAFQLLRTSFPAAKEFLSPAQWISARIGIRIRFFGLLDFVSSEWISMREKKRIAASDLLDFNANKKGIAASDFSGWLTLSQMSGFPCEEKGIAASEFLGWLTLSQVSGSLCEQKGIAASDFLGWLTLSQMSGSPCEQEEIAASDCLGWLTFSQMSGFPCEQKRDCCI